MAKSDRELIEELVATYALALDDRDYDALAACFEPDAVTEFAGFSQVDEGIDAVMAHMRKALDPLDVTQHYFSNFIIDIDGDTAKMRAYALGQHVVFGAPGGEFFLSGGRYTVDLVKRDGQWRFKRIAARSTWGDGNRAMLPKI